ncbi:MAG: response regulator [Planctomycetota bacterium]
MHEARLKILVIDDILFTRKVYFKILSSVYDIFEASNGQEGLELYHQIHPDLVICDLLMPQFSGFDFLLQYAKIPNRAPVIICSADVQEETREKCFDLGADEFIQKPGLTDSASFLEILRRNLAMQQPD